MDLFWVGGGVSGLLRDYIHCNMIVEILLKLSVSLQCFLPGFSSPRFITRATQSKIFIS